ncbi:hypothetical protein RYX36_031230, partial [Vicia faba]
MEGDHSKPQIMEGHTNSCPPPMQHNRSRPTGPRIKGCRHNLRGGRGKLVESTNFISTNIL